MHPEQLLDDVVRLFRHGAGTERHMRLAILQAEQARVDEKADANRRVQLLEADEDRREDA